MKFRLALAVVFACGSFSGWSAPFFPPSDTSISSLKFLGEYDIPFNYNFKSTTVGGLSGIDYDRKTDTYYMICDDRSAINPVRYYTAKIKITPTGIDTVEFLDVHSLLQPNGKPFPSAKEDPALVPDPEAIRYNPKTKQIVWTSEGERNVKATPVVLVDPSINLANPDGSYAGKFDIPENLKMKSTDNGPRQNGVLEGITYTDDYKTLFVSLEEPRYEDGPRADVVKTDSWIRIYRYDAATKKNTGQYAYALEPVAKKPKPETAFKVNGVSEIFALSANKLLVMERSFSTGHLACVIKVFVADLKHAGNVADVNSLTENPPTAPASKKLLLNMDDMTQYIDNIEGITYGPDLPNGHKTLLFIGDNNFNFLEKAQVLLFEVIP
ncbi:MAG: esterase-like activity of phytase family protein [Bacteroidetes bacterium]|nr:esterase-like activity of phytase family protein [Bacteroidota bacterium]